MVKAILIDQTAGLLLLTVPVLISGNGAASGWLFQSLSINRADSFSQIALVKCM